MAVFLTNKCKWNGCGITFPNLGDLIQHIEDTHIDYDPKVVEQKEQAQPACLPLSYVLRFISEDARKENPFIASPTNGSELKRKLAIKHHSYSMSSSNRSNTPTGSEMDEDEMVVTESEDSNDSWTTEEFSSEFIMRYGSRHSGTGSNGTPGNEKPFACPVPGCKKRYKNVNGIKYHSKNGHKKDGKVRKGYKCHCGKSYKTAQGLKNHALASHNTASESTLTTQHIVANSGGILMPRSTSPSQSLGSLSPSSISNMSSSASSCHGGSSNAAILQHLTNNVSATITTNNGNGNGHSTPGINGNSSSNPMNLQIQQQQFNGANTAQQILQQPPPVAAAAMQISEIFPTTLSAAAVSMQPKQSINNASSSSLTSIRTSAASTVPSALSAATATATTAQTMKMSTTFIEHKYSAKKCKEKFYANLRNDTNNNNDKNNNNNNNSKTHNKNSNNVGKNKTHNNNNNGKHKQKQQKANSLSLSSSSTSSKNSKTKSCDNFVIAAANTAASIPTPVAAAGGIGGHDALKIVHSSVYELNENFKNIFT